MEVISLERAQQLLDAAEREAALARQRQTPPPSNQVRVPYVAGEPEERNARGAAQRDHRQAKNERWGSPDALPQWLEPHHVERRFPPALSRRFLRQGNFPFSPDVQAINDAGGVTTADGFPFVNATEDRNRVQYRGRIELSAKVSEGVKVGFGTASGQDNGPISTNKTFGDYFAKNPAGSTLLTSKRGRSIGSR